MLLGGPFVYWFGPKPRICIYDYELVKQIIANKSGHFVKKDPHPTVLAIIGKGLILVEGKDWVRHRGVVNPAFAIDKLKVTAYSFKLLKHVLASFQKSTVGNFIMILNYRR
jgi:PHYB activation tagged suppressor 1